MVFIHCPGTPSGWSAYAIHGLLSERPEARIAVKEIKALCDVVRKTAFEIHLFHGHGHLEKVYENGLAHRLRKTGLVVKQQEPLKVFDEDGTLIGDYFADLLIEDCLVAELKTVKTLAPEHVAQLLGYLKSARLQHGLLINFGSYKFQIEKLIWDHHRETNRVV